MGVEMIRKSVKFPLRMVERLEIEKERFSPFCENESDVIRLLLRIVFRCIDAGMLEQIVAVLQGTLRSTSTYAAEELLAFPKVEERAGPETSSFGPRVDKLTGTNRRVAVLVPVMETVAFFSPFFRTQMARSVPA
jgi:hypothetical protein